MQTSPKSYHVFGVTDKGGGLPIVFQRLSPPEGLSRGDANNLAKHSRRSENKVAVYNGDHLRSLHA